MKRIDLENVRWKKEKVQLLRSQIAELEEMMECVRVSKISDMPKVKGGMDSDRIERLIDKKDELKRECVKEIGVLIYEIKRVNDFVATLSEREQVMLKLRFFENKTWFEVADIMGYDISTIFAWWKKIVQLTD